MRLPLTFRDTQFGELFAAVAATLVDQAGLLSEMLGAEETERQRLAGRVRDLDHSTEAGVHSILSALAAAFVTPVDRVDVYQLAWGLRLCARRIDAVADQLTLFRMGPLPSGVTEQVHSITRVADAARTAVPQLTQLPAMSDSWVEITRLRKQAGAVHRRLIADLCGSGTDVISLTRLVTVANGLEQTVQAFEDVAQILERIVVKEG